MEVPALRPYLVEAEGPIWANVFAPEPSKGVLRLLNSSRNGIRYRLVDWETFASVQPEVFVRVLVLRDGDDRRYAHGLLGRLEASLPLTATVLAIPRVETLRSVWCGESIHRVVLMDDSVELDDTVLDLVDRSLVESIPPSLTRIMDPPPDLVVRQTLDWICGPLPIPKTVTRVAGELGVAASTLTRHWQETFVAGILRPVVFLDAVILARAMELAARSRTLDPVLDGLSLHRRTLERISLRLTGRTPSDLTNIRPLAVTRAIVRAVSGIEVFAGGGDSVASA